MYSPSQIPPCPGYPMFVQFPDVTPDVLEHEAEREAQQADGQGADAWQAYLRRVLPALEQDVPTEMARALLDAGTPAVAARAHAERMRRRAVGAGSVRRARFWQNVARAIKPATGRG